MCGVFSDQGPAGRQRFCESAGSLAGSSRNFLVMSLRSASSDLLASAAAGDSCAGCNARQFRIAAELDIPATPNWLGWVVQLTGSVIIERRAETRWSGFHTDCVPEERLTVAPACSVAWPLVGHSMSAADTITALADNPSRARFC
jgi:hypothetical protein